MKKLLLLALLFTCAYTSNAQIVDAKQVKVADSLKLKTDWITGILKDTALVGASAKTLPTSDAVVKYIANRLAFVVKYGDTAAFLAGYARVQRLIDTAVAIQARIQTKLTKSDADTYYPAIQRLIDTAVAIQARVQTKLTKTDADTYYPAIQRLIDTAVAIQARIQSKLTKSDADTWYVPLTRTVNGYALSSNITLSKSDVGLSNVPNTDATNPANITQSSSYRFTTDAEKTTWNGKQNALGYTPENVSNKATDFNTLNNTLYPTTQAVANYTQSALTGVLKDMGNYDASGNAFPSSGGSGTSGAIKKGDMWYISVAGTLGGTAAAIGSWVRALTDAPGQTAGNWGIAKGNFGFTPANEARTLTINGTTYDISANRSWSVGTVTSVGVSVPTGLIVTSGSPVTGSGTIAIGLQSGYSIPTTSDQTNWNTAYGWGNHASAGYSTASNTQTFTNKTWNGVAIGDSYISSSSNWNTAYNKRISSASLSTSLLTITLADATTVTASVPTWNQNTTGNAATATKAYMNQDNTSNGSYPIVWASTSSGNSDLNASNTRFTVNPSTGVMVAPTFSGSLSGTASNATQWSGYSYGGGYSSGTIGYTMIFNTTNNRFEAATVGTMQSWLGLGSMAYASTGSYLPLTAGSGNPLSGRLYANAGIATNFAYADVAGSNTVGAGPYFQIGSATNNRFWIWQMNASYNADMWSYNGTSWVVRHTFNQDGGLIIGGSLGANAATTNTIYNGSGYSGASIIGDVGNWAIRTGTAHDINFDVYNAGNPKNAVKINQNTRLDFNSIQTQAVTFNSTGTSPYWQFGETTNGYYGYVGFGSSLWSSSNANDFIIRGDNRLVLGSGNSGDLIVNTNHTIRTAKDLYVGAGVNTQMFLDRANSSGYSQFNYTTNGTAEWATGMGVSEVSSKWELYSFSLGSYVLRANNSTGAITASNTITATGFIGYTSNYVDVASAYGTFCGVSQHWIKIKADNGNYYYFLAYNGICPN